MKKVLNPHKTARFREWIAEYRTGKRYNKLFAQGQRHSIERTANACGRSDALAKAANQGRSGY